MMRFFVKFFQSFGLAALLIFACAAAGRAQQPDAPKNPSPSSTNQQTPTVDPQTADVAITANVTAKELKFETVPNPTVEFPGKPERVTVWEADRQNLPKPVEPGVTYRNIGIRLRIASRFADIDRIVAEALGEVPVSENQPPPAASSERTNGEAAPVTTASSAKTAAKVNASPNRKLVGNKRR